MNYREDAHGVYSLRLYSRAASRDLTAYLAARRGWEGSLIREQFRPGRYRTVSKPDVRSALILPHHLGGRVRRSFARRLGARVLPLVERAWGVRFDGTHELQVVKYVPGGRYNPHRDSGMDMMYRYFTVVCYLNDDFRGGQTSFPSLGYSASPECGRAIIFPAAYTHSAEPVSEGNKYALVAWIHGPVPVRWA